MSTSERRLRPDIAAVVPAAGFSTRMREFKPLLPFGDSTVVEQVIATLRSVGLETIRVVVGWQADRLVPVLDRAGVAWVWNPRYADGMYTSIQAGIRTLPEQAKAFFVLPGDMPLVRRAALQCLIDAWDARPDGILYPGWNGRRGHPPLIACRFAPVLLAESPSGGLRTLLARYADATRDIECPDPGVLIDLDTPEEYDRACGDRRRRGSPIIN